MRRQAAAAGITLISHVEGTACSAAYALACAAGRIVISDVAVLGSIGVIVQPVDTSAAEAAAGIRVNIISSGERKADGNPHAAMSEQARLAIQQTVDTMAQVFYEHIGATRGARLTASDAFELQAGVRVGHAAVAAGLADEVCSLAGLVEKLGFTFSYSTASSARGIPLLATGAQ